MGNNRVYLYFCIAAMELLVGIVFMASAFGQADTVKTQKIDNDVKYHWAIQFQLPDQFSRRGDEGAFAYIKYNLNKNKAIRWGVGFSGYYTWNKTETLSDSTINSSDINGHSASFKIHYQSNLSDAKRLNGYWAVGPLFSYFWDDEANDNNNNGAYDDRHWHRSWNLGISANIGAEYMLRNDFGISAEYELESYYGCLKHWNYSSDYPSGNRQYITKKLAWKIRDIKIGASLYF